MFSSCLILPTKPTPVLLQISLTYSKPFLAAVKFCPTIASSFLLKCAFTVSSTRFSSPQVPITAP